MTSVAALVAAAGSGQRLGLGPKAFVRLAGRTLLEIAHDAFRDLASELVVAVPAGEEERARELMPGAIVIAGGADRQHTVGRLLAASSSELVLVHDVARPYLTPAVARRVLSAVAEVGAASAALAPADTVVRAADGHVLDREALRLIQTPQGFRRELLLEAHRAAAAAGHSATDDTALVRRLGHEVRLVQGSPLLAKLTAADDLPLLEALHDVWRGQLEGDADAAG